MSAKVSKRPSIAVVGAGSLGTALAISLHAAGFKISEIITRNRKVSRQRGRSLARRVNARAMVLRDPRIHGGLVWLCVPDREIPSCAAGLSREHWTGRIVLHSSGALDSDALRALQKRGAHVASVHPLMTFVAGSPPSFAGVPFAIEGDAPALRTVKQILLRMGAQAYPIRKQNKAAYHAWGTFASPLLTALLATTEQVARKAGVSTQQARKRMMPILRQTLVNYACFGAADCFSGPLVRGDVETVKRHLRALESSVVARNVYAALARAALEYLPTKNKGDLQRVIARALRR